MALSINDIKFDVALPKVPPTIDLMELRAPTMEDRKRSIDVLARRLDLGELRMAELPGFIALASKRGDIQFFPASGGLIARDAAIAETSGNEERKWNGLTKGKVGDETIYSLNRTASAALVKQARALLDECGLVSGEMTEPVVDLDQVAHMDEKGKILSEGAGTATVRIGYSMHGLPVAGAGAKSIVYAEPRDNDALVTGTFHCWRTPGAAKQMKMPGLEESLAAGLLVDRELDILHKKGQRIRITRLDLCYLALPAFVEQRMLCPAFQVEGVAEGKPAGAARGLTEVRFGRFVQAATVKHYASAGVYAHYLNQPSSARAAAAAR